jgi:hypothetical protein
MMEPVNPAEKAQDIDQVAMTRTLVNIMNMQKDAHPRARGENVLLAL